jgi:16S rRNA (uracil1498-N3)-methyltransferase
MASPPWFYYPFDDIDTATLELSGEEVTHIIGARRLRVGDQLVLINGQGKMAHCALEETSKKLKSVKLRISLVAEVDPPDKEIILACALPKGDRLSTMLDMTCQLGITAFQPLHFEHSEAKWNDHQNRRCERILIEACKQSRNSNVPRIDPMCSFNEFISDKLSPQSLTLLADQFGRPSNAYTSQIKAADILCIVVGPEGGLSAAEIELTQQHKIVPLRLANAVLRIETAAIAAVTALQVSAAE